MRSASAPTPAPDRASSASARRAADAVAIEGLERGAPFDERAVRRQERIEGNGRLRCVDARDRRRETVAASDSVLDVGFAVLLRANRLANRLHRLDDAVVSHG